MSSELVVEHNHGRRLYKEHVAHHIRDSELSLFAQRIRAHDPHCQTKTTRADIAYFIRRHCTGFPLDKTGTEAHWRAIA